MPLDPNIILQGRVPDVGSAIDSGILNASRLSAMQTEQLQRDLLTERIQQLRNPDPTLERINQAKAVADERSAVEPIIQQAAIDIAPLLGSEEGKIKALRRAYQLKEELRQTGIQSAPQIGRGIDNFISAIESGDDAAASSMIASIINPQQKPLTTSNITTIIDQETGTPKIVMVEESVGETPAPKEMVNRNFENKPLTTDESLKWVSSDGRRHPESMEERSNPTKYGFRLIGTEAQKQIQAEQGAKALLGELQELSGKADPFSDKGFFNRFSKTAKNLFEQVTGDNTNLSAFVDSRKATLSLLVRALGEKGTLTVQDVARIDNAIPRASGYDLGSGKMVDTKDIAEAKWKALGGIIESIAASVIERGGKTDAGTMKNITDQINSGNPIAPFPGFDLLSPSEQKEVLEAYGG